MIYVLCTLLEIKYKKSLCCASTGDATAAANNNLHDHIPFPYTPRFDKLECFHTLAHDYVNKTIIITEFHRCWQNKPCWKIYREIMRFHTDVYRRISQAIKSIYIYIYMQVFVTMEFIYIWTMEENVNCKRPRQHHKMVIVTISQTQFNTDNVGDSEIIFRPLF